MFKLKIGRLTLAVLLAAALIAPASAPAFDAHMKAIMLTAEMQSVSFSGLITVTSGLVTENPVADKETSEKLTKLGQELDNLVSGKAERYLIKVKNRSQAMTELGDKLVTRFKLTGQIDRDLAAELGRTSLSRMYAVDQLVRHIAATIDLTKMTQAQRLKLVEVELVMRMETELLMALGEAFAGSMVWRQLEPERFWWSLGRFDYMATMFETLVDLNAPQNQDKAALFNKLKALKGRAATKGDRLFRSASRLGEPSMGFARELLALTKEITPTLERLKKTVEPSI